LQVQAASALLFEMLGNYCTMLTIGSQGFTHYMLSSLLTIMWHYVLYIGSLPIFSMTGDIWQVLTCSYQGGFAMILSVQLGKQWLELVQRALVRGHASVLSLDELSSLVYVPSVSSWMLLYHSSCSFSPLIVGGSLDTILSMMFVVCL
jgi:hypothetical protein